MPNSPTHDFLTVVTGVALMPFVWSTLPDGNLALATTVATSHLISGVLFSPDLDLYSTPYRRWGPLRFLWYPYREMIAHRSWISHSLVVGPILRLVYFAGACGFIFFVLTFLIGMVRPVDGSALLTWLSELLRGLWGDHRSYFYAALFGFITGGAVHTIADWMTEVDPFHGTLLSKRRRRRRRRDDGGWL